jgi:lipopolysaccharide export system permease protein
LDADVRLLDRHVLTETVVAAGGATGAFVFVLVAGNVLNQVSGAVASGRVSGWEGIELITLLIPGVLPYAMPLGLLTGVLLAFGRMGSQHEITAMRAAGLSLFYVARPILVLGALAAALSAAVNYEYMPRARALYKETLAKAVQRNPLSFIVPKTFIRDFPGVVLYVGEKKGNELRDVWMWELDRESRVKRSGRAAAGVVEYRENDGLLVLRLRRVNIEARKSDRPEDFSVPVAPLFAEEFPIELHLETLFGRRNVQKKLAWMTLAELRAEEARLAEAAAAPGANPGESRKSQMKVAFAMSEKGSTALAVFAFAFLAVPLGIKVSRKETSANLGVALVLVMGYYFLSVCVGWLEGRPEWRPDLLLWLPALLFLSLAGWLFSRLGRV